jgi:hypothetical protein
MKTYLSKFFYTIFLAIEVRLSLFIYYEDIKWRLKLQHANFIFKLIGQPYPEDLSFN